VSASWDYGVEGAAYPVAPGQVWQVGAEHTVVCSDLLTSPLLSRTIADLKRPVTLVYTDPPWGQGLLNGFRSKAGLAKATYTWDLLYRRIMVMAAEVGAPCFMECSAAETKDGRQLTAALGQAFSTYYWPITYYRTKPAGLYYRHTAPPPDALTAVDGGLDGLDDDLTPTVVLAAYQPGLVLDPCAGRGLTARTAARGTGWHSLSNELNPRRASAMLARLAAATGTHPQRA
jgi:hypothetical protein